MPPRTTPYAPSTASTAIIALVSILMGAFMLFTGIRAWDAALMAPGLLLLAGGMSIIEAIRPGHEEHQ